MSELKLVAQPRTMTGRKVRQLRAQGLVPVVVYGKTTEPINLQVNARSLDLALHQGGSSQLVTLAVEGGATHNVLLRELQRHPVNRSYTHADFYAVNMLEQQHVSVQLIGQGKPVGMATGLMVLQALDSVMVSALPADIPASIEVDLTPLDLEKPILVSDLPAVQGVEYLAEPHEHVFSLIATRGEVEEGAETEEVAEPEVVTRGKQDEDEG
jgi:large subunit ribosomal protein L25